MEKRRENSENTVRICYSCDDAYAGVLGASLCSLISCIRCDRNYEIYVLERNLKKKNKIHLRKIAQRKENVLLFFINVGPVLGKNTIPTMLSYIREATWYRLMIPELLPDKEKILYLDCDTIICTDPGELYDIPLHGKLFAAVPDIDFMGRLQGQDPVILSYSRDVLKMRKEQIYYQAGILLMDISALKGQMEDRQWIRISKDSEYRYNDQDYLNVHFSDCFEALPAYWNVLTDCNHTRIKEVASKAEEKLFCEYLSARKQPGIIHYAGHIKPWIRHGEDMSWVFWHYARKTPFYTKLRLRYAVYDMIYSMAYSLFPKGSRRRKALKKMMTK